MMCMWTRSALRLKQEVMDADGFVNRERAFAFMVCSRTCVAELAAVVQNFVQNTQNKKPMMRSVFIQK